MWTENCQIRRRQRLNDFPELRQKLNLLRKLRYHNDPEYRDKIIKRNQQRNSTPEQRIKKNLSQRKAQAKQKGLEFSITLDDLLPLPFYCPVLGHKLNYTGSSIKNKEFSPSIDRIDNTKGYIKNNVIIISNRANTLKSDATVEEIRLLADFMEKQLDV